MAAASPLDLGDADDVDVEAIGDPGRRTFRLLAERGTTTVSLWLEKEQLQSLAVIIEQHLARFRLDRSGQERALLTLAARFPARATVDFKAGRLSLGYDQEATRFIVTAEELGDSPDSARGVSWRVTASQARSICAKTADIVAAGRPRCPLCGAPIEGKHVCPLSNGHAR